MCIIVDANTTCDFVSNSDDAKPIWRSIRTGKLRLVVGGRLKSEWSRTKLRSMYRQLQMAGVIREYSDKLLEGAIGELQGATLRSDDPHVIALARVSGARLLFSRDKRLHEDFKDPRLLTSPRGSIYQSAEHARLLEKNLCLKG